MVVSVDRSWVLCSAGGSQLLGGGEQRVDCFVSKDDQRGHRSQTNRDRLVVACLGYSADDYRQRKNEPPNGK
jgi:hypothetical protein